METPEIQPPDANSNDSNRRRQKVITAFVLTLAVVVVAVGVTLSGTNKKNDSADGAATAQTSPPTSQTTSQSTNATSDTSTTQYKDGSYTADGSYMTPGGQESIGVSLTLKDGVVTDTSLKQSANNRQTKEYQAKFASGYKQQVVGKKLTDIKVSRVSGSSLTSEGFDDALQAIETQAQIKS